MTPIRTTCLTCGRDVMRPPTGTRFCSPEHEAAWWHSRRQLASVSSEVENGQPEAPVTAAKIKIDTSDPATKATWEAARRAKAEVESWPAWKRGEPSCDGCLGGIPAHPCAITGAPVHDDGEHASTCRDPAPDDDEPDAWTAWYREHGRDPDEPRPVQAPNDEDVERVARYLCSLVADMRPFPYAVPEHWRDVALAVLAGGFDPGRIP